MRKVLCVHFIPVLLRVKRQSELAAIPPMRACVCLNDNQWRHRRQRSVIPAGTGMARRGEEITGDAARV